MWRQWVIMEGEQRWRHGGDGAEKMGGDWVMGDGRRVRSAKMTEIWRQGLAPEGHPIPDFFGEIPVSTRYPKPEIP
jgi:hypothetical protein